MCTLYPVPPNGYLLHNVQYQNQDTDIGYNMYVYFCHFITCKIHVTPIVTKIQTVASPQKCPFFYPFIATHIHLSSPQHP